MGGLKQSEILLVVEDDAELRDALVESLQELNCLLYSFGNAEDALLFAKEKNCFAIISDFRMPGMNGVEFCKKIKRERADCRFVLLTGFADKQTAIEGLKFGIDDILEKPQDLARLHSLAESYLADRLAVTEKELNDALRYRADFSEKFYRSIGEIEGHVALLKDSRFKPNLVQDMAQSAMDIVMTSKGVEGAGNIFLVSCAYEKLLGSIQEQGNVYPHGVIQVLVQGIEVIKSLAADFAQVRERTVNLKPVIEALGRWTETHSEDEPVVSPKTDTLFGSEDTDELEAPDFEGVDESVIAGYLSQYRLNEAALARYTAQQETDYNSAHLVVTDASLNSVRDLAGELLVVKSAYNATVQALLSESLNVEQRHHAEEMVHSLNLVSEKIESHVMQMRKISLKDIFYHFPEMVQKMSADSGKAVRLEMSGLDFGVDKAIADVLARVTTRLIWSSLTFGIEDVDDRIEKSKSVTGDIRIHASQNGHLISISVGDDGYGIDPEQLKKQAVERGLITKDESYLMQPKDALDLLYLPEISRRRALTNDAGIIYGLEKLKTDLESLGGRCSVESSFGMGTRITVEIPVPKAVRTEQALLADSGGCKIVVPMQSVAKVTPIKDLILSRVDGRMTCQYEGSTIPLGDFRYFTATKTNEGFLDRDELCPDSMVLVVSDEEHALGLVVDEVVAQLNAVVQPFDNVIESLVGFRGTTLLDAQRVAFVIDPETLLGAAYAA